MISSEQLPCGVFSMTLGGEIIDANKAFLDMVQYTHDELICKNIEELLSIANKVIYHMSFITISKNNESLSELYLTLRGKNGAEVPVLINATLDSADQIITCVAIKIQKRIDYEKQLKEVKSELEAAYTEKQNILERESILRGLFETTFLSINEGIIVTDIYEQIVLMNKNAEEYTGYSLDEASGKKYTEVFNIVDSKTGVDVSDIFKNASDLVLSKSYADDLMLISRDGTQTYVAINVGMRTSEEGAQTGAVIAFMDRTKEYIQQREINGFLNVNLDMLAVADLEGRLHKVNKKFEEILGYSSEELIGHKFLEFVHEKDKEITLKAMAEVESNNYVSGFVNRYRCKDGTYKYIQWNGERGPGKYVYASAKDFTENQLKVNNLNRIAETDELTGVYNRHHLSKISRKLMLKADISNKKLSVAVIDLDHFKLVNDNYGHPVGDEILKLAAFIIKSNIRSSDIVVRVGGEEFLVIFKDTDEYQAIAAAEKIRLSFERFEFPETGKQTISIGVSESINNEGFDELYRRADSALLMAKQTGRNKVFKYKQNKS